MYLAHCLVKKEEHIPIDEISARIRKSEEHVSFFCQDSSPAELTKLIMQLQRIQQHDNKNYSIRLLSMTDMGKAISRTTMLKLDVMELSTSIIASMRNQIKESNT